MSLCKVNQLNFKLIHSKSSDKHENSYLQSHKHRHDTNYVCFFKLFGELIKARWRKEEYYALRLFECKHGEKKTRMKKTRNQKQRDNKNKPTTRKMLGS